MRLQSAVESLVTELWVLESPASGVEERPHRCDKELESRVSAEAIDEMLAIWNRLHYVLIRLVGYSNHEEEVEPSAAVRQTRLQSCPLSCCWELGT